MQNNNLHNSKKTVLFLCTGNSCRSQMAEAIVNTKFGYTWQAISAGTRPAGYVHPLAIDVLEEIGINHQGTSKSASTFMNRSLDLVVTVCDTAAADCPVWFGGTQQVHMGFEDPAAFQGDDFAKREIFRRVRDDIAQKIPGLLARY
jgi:arsenate reductase